VIRASAGEAASFARPAQPWWQTRAGTALQLQGGVPGLDHGVVQRRAFPSTARRPAAGTPAGRPARCTRCPDRCGTPRRGRHRGGRRPPSPAPRRQTPRRDGCRARAAALPHATGFPRLGVLRRLHPVPDRSAVGGPGPSVRAGCAAAGRTGTVPVFTAIRSTEEEPDSVPAASPRLPRSTPPWSPGQPPKNSPGVPCARAGAHRSRPISARFEPVQPLRDVNAGSRVLLSVTLAGPAPSGSAGTSRLCQGCSRPPRHHPDQAAPSFALLLRQDRR
jgi:hypothetical protein